MTSTRNKNMRNEYKIEQELNNKIMDNNLYLNSQYGKPIDEHIPAIGYIPSHMSRDTFSKNSIDVESCLKGIGSTNLVTPKEPVHPSYNNIQFKEWFERPTSVIMPAPMFYNIERPDLS